MDPLFFSKNYLKPSIYVQKVPSHLSLCQGEAASARGRCNQDQEVGQGELVTQGAK